jgi:alpha-amylase
LQWRSPNFVYKPVGTKKIKLLLKNYKLSDDIAFRFSQQSWSEWPLTADKFAYWLHQAGEHHDVINLFMDYETFGEHQWQSTGIFEFLRHLPEKIWQHPGYSFMTPSEVSKTFEAKGELDIHDPISWADLERDLSAWLGNSLQDSACEFIYSMEKDVLATKNEDIIHAWRKLQTSDHFYYMCIKWFNDGEVHKYFNPYNSPYDAFIYHTNAVNQLRWAVNSILVAQKEERHQQKIAQKRKDAARHILPSGEENPGASISDNIPAANPTRNLPNIA